MVSWASEAKYGAKKGIFGAVSGVLDFVADFVHVHELAWAGLGGSVLLADDALFYEFVDFPVPDDVLRRDFVPVREFSYEFDECLPLFFGRGAQVSVSREADADGVVVDPSCVCACFGEWASSFYFTTAPDYEVIADVLVALFFVPLRDFLRSRVLTPLTARVCSGVNYDVPNLACHVPDCTCVCRVDSALQIFSHAKYLRFGGKFGGNSGEIRGKLGVKT